MCIGKYQDYDMNSDGGARTSMNSEVGGARNLSKTVHFKEALTSNDTYGQYNKPKPPMFDIKPLVANGTIKLASSVKSKMA